MGHDAVVDNRGVPRPIYTDPEIAAVGLTEARGARAVRRRRRRRHRSRGSRTRAPSCRTRPSAGSKSIHETRYGELLGLVHRRPARDGPDRGRRRRARRRGDGRDGRRRDGAAPDAVRSAQGSGACGSRAADPRGAAAARPRLRLSGGRQAAGASFRRFGDLPLRWLLSSRRRRARDRTFERLYRRHVKDVYRYAFAVLQNRADAEDVTQTTFLNAYRAFERGERPDKPHNWLIAIAHNVCRQRFRQSQRRPKEVALDERPSSSSSATTTTPERRRHPARAHAPSVQPACGARHARARRTLVRGDRADCSSSRSARWRR